MGEEKLSALLGTAIVPAIIDCLTAGGEDYQAMLDQFYRSKLFSQLSEPATGLWHLSAATLAEMYNEERQFGDFSVPEEQS